MKYILQFILKILSKIVLLKYKPEIAAVTGSVGKTSAKEAIYATLTPHFKVRRNAENYNNEIGVPLTILGVKTAGRSFSQWFRNFYQALKIILWRADYPDILVLEMGADKPNDIKYLTSFVPVKIGVVTAIGQFPVHIEFFPERDKLIEEKAVLIKMLPPQQTAHKNGLAVLNYDDLSVRMMRENVPQGAEIITYGFGEGADLRITDYGLRTIDFKNGDYGINFKFEYQGSVVPVKLFRVLGKQQAYAAGAAAAVGLYFGLNLVDISNGLKKYRSLPGRTNLIKGIKQTWIIDDTYNASPSAVIAALEILNQFAENNILNNETAGQKQRKIAVLGDMLELGQWTEEAHRTVGREAAAVVNLIFTVGSRAKFIADELEKHGFSKEKIFKFNTSEQAGRILQEKLEMGDIVLVKGSQAMQMEKVVEEIRQI